MLLGAVLAGAVAWRLHVRSVEQQIAAKRRALKQLVVSGGIAPTEAVMAYLEERGSALEQHHARWMALVSASVSNEALTTDPQLYFQEQVHDLQRTLERLSTARGLATPELLGVPKELPPRDTVPRLLVQLSLIKDVTEMILAQDVTSFSSCKVEDPEPMMETDAHQPSLLRLPVRMRLTATMPVLLRLLGAVQHARPIMSVQAVRMSVGDSPDVLDVELVIARFLALTREPALEARGAVALPASTAGVSGSVGTLPR